jgi:predicted permease
MNDLRFAFRQLLKNPGFTAVAVLSLALGIGATTTVFCWMERVLFQPLAGVPDQERVVALCTTFGGRQSDCVSHPDLRDYRGLTNIFRGVIGSQVTPACIEVEGQRHWAYGQIATVSFFEVLGLRPALGRFFRPDEEQKPGGHPVLVLSHAYWQRQFGGDPRIVGRSVLVNRHSFEIIGVAPGGFQGTMSGLSCDFWAPLMMHQQVANFGSLEERGDRWLHTQARLQPGISLRGAQAAVDVRAHQLEVAHPDRNRKVGVKVLRMMDAPYGGQALFLPVLRVLMAVSVGVLLIVAANVANLLLARASIRQKEVAIRLALGAGRVRLLRQFLTESTALAFLGGVVGVCLAAWAANLFQHFTPKTYLPVGYEFTIDLRTLGFTALVTLATGLVFGMAPALQMLRPRLQAALKEGGRTSATGSGRHRLRAYLVVTEFSVAVLLLVGAGLCIRGFQRARTLDLGFRPQGLLLGGLRVGMNGHTEATAMVFYRKLHERLRASNGVQAAALASWFPLGFEGGPGTGVVPEGYQAEPGEDTGASYAIISPDYFQTMGIPVLAGREFSERDTAESEPVVIINDELAQHFWPGQNAVGRKVRCYGSRVATVVGVVKTGKYRTLNERPRRFVYSPYLQGVWDLNLGVVLRSRGESESAAAVLRQTIREVDPAVELWAVIAYRDFVQAAFMAPRIASSLLMVLGAVALGLAAMGIYAVMAYVVSQRTNEIGVRLVLGAPPATVLGMVVREGMNLALGGIGVGVIGALAGSHLLGSFLNGISPFDGWTFGGVVVLVLGVALAACYLPARRATRVDPMVALRCE